MSQQKNKVIDILSHWVRKSTNEITPTDSSNGHINPSKIPTNSDSNIEISKIISMIENLALTTDNLVKKTNKVPNKIINILSLLVPLLISIPAFVLSINTSIIKDSTRIDNIETKVDKIDDKANEINDLEKDIAVIKNDIMYMKGAISSLDEELKKLNDKYNNMLTAKTSDTLTTYLFVNPNTKFQNIIFSNFHSENSESSSNASLIDINEDTIIGKNQLGEEMSFKEIEEKPFCAAYMENDTEVWFYGKIDKLGKWDGLCILNNYINNSLVTVFEAYYRNGIRHDGYKSISYENDEYILNERTLMGDYNDGITYKYKQLEWLTSDFKLDIPVRYSDCLPSHKISYYSGRTANGVYNDNTGQAFLINYNEDGTVKMLYQGCLSNGIISDERPFDAEHPQNNAFMIFSSKSAYWYYNGSFANNKPTNENPIVQIKNHENPSNWLPEQNMYPELKWKIFDSSPI